jgi:hypothetical protein
VLVCVMLDAVFSGVLDGHHRGGGILVCMRVLCLGAGDVFTVAFASSQFHPESLLLDNTCHLLHAARGGGRRGGCGFCGGGGGTQSRQRY